MDASTRLTSLAKCRYSRVARESVSLSLAIETPYQNMAVWRRRWKRHILLAIVNVVPSAMWISTNLLVILHERFKESLYISLAECRSLRECTSRQVCRSDLMPFFQLGSAVFHQCCNTYAYI